MSKPTLTVSVPCPTCGGTKRKTIIDNPAVGDIVQPGVIWTPCPDCTDGTIQQAVSCQSCKWFNRGECDNLVAGNEDQVWQLLVEPDWGCLSWEGDE